MDSACIRELQGTGKTNLTITEGVAQAHLDQCILLRDISAQGCSLDILTEGNGVVVRTADYDAYGQPVSTSGSTSTPFGYAGEYTDAETGFLYLRARSDDPATQQFLTVDPLLAATEQAYTYAGGSPTNATDPSGLKLISPDSGGGGGLPAGIPYGVTGSGEVVPAGGGSSFSQPNLINEFLDTAGGGYAAVQNAQRILKTQGGNTGAVATTQSGQLFHSGWSETRWANKGFAPTVAEQVHQCAGEMGVPFPARATLDPPGQPGLWHASHVEPQAAWTMKYGGTAKEVIAVSKNMCPECQVFFHAYADYTGEVWVVADPSGVLTFSPGNYSYEPWRP